MILCYFTLHLIRSLFHLGNFHTFYLSTMELVTLVLYNLGYHYLNFICLAYLIWFK